MKIALVFSKRIKTGINVRGFLLKLYNFKKIGMFNGNPVYKQKNIFLYTLNKKIHYSEKNLGEIDADFFIAPHFHCIDYYPKRFTVHPCGNWGKKWVKWGGKKGEFSCVDPLLLKIMLLSLVKNNPFPDFKVSIEASHHGPLVDKPILFVEIGSNKTQYAKKENAKVLATAIMDALKQFSFKNIKKPKIAIGIGSEHCAENFSKIMIEKDIAFSHICPGYQISELNKESLKKAIEKTKGKVDMIIVDKNFKMSKKISKILNSTGLPILSADEMM